MSPPPPSAYREHAPHPALARYVECYWSIRRDAASTSRATARGSPGTDGGAPAPRGFDSTLSDDIDHVLPDGCMDVIFALAGDARSTLPTGASIAVGTMTEPLEVRRSGSMLLWGVRFRAGAGAAFIGIGASELTDGAAALSDVWSGRAAEGCERLADASDDHARVGVLDRLLRRRLGRAEARLDARVLAACEAISADGGQAPVDELTRLAGLGRRQLERRFAADVGVSPKVACRVARLRRSLRLLRNEPAHVGLSTIALRAGYADQAHFTRELRALAWTTPGAYRASASSPTESA